MKFFLCLIGWIILVTGCAKQGLITERYEKDFYAIPKTLPDTLSENASNRFIIYGDNRQGYRLNEIFLRKQNWKSPKQLIFPFYQMYLMGNGIYGGINYLRKIPDFGKSTRVMVRDAIYNEAKRSPVDFVLHTGDFVADGRYPHNWVTFIRENKIERPLMTEFPYLAMIGNHEFANDTTYGFPNYHAIFPYPRFYTVETEYATLIVVDSDIIVDQYEYIDQNDQEALFYKWFVSRPGSNEKSWLEQQLAASTKPYKILLSHHPPVSFGRHHVDWLKPKNGIDLPGKRKALLQLLADSEVNLIVTAHEHYYEHNQVNITKADGELHHLHVVVSGGGGVTLRELTDDMKYAAYLKNYEKEGLDVQMVTQKKIYNYCLFNLNSMQMRVRIMKVSQEDSIVTEIADELVFEKK